MSKEAISLLTFILLHCFLLLVLLYYIRQKAVGGNIMKQHESQETASIQNKVKTAKVSVARPPSKPVQKITKEKSD